ncbi:MAG: fumarylacetoacetate hydrolase family protein [Aestuariibacter sp.]|nr:fumarylacetoacetate hydrolase family protein [Aestuariibacter sp.]
MKLVRFGDAGLEIPGVLDADGKIRSLHEVIGDVDGTSISPDSLRELASIDPKSLPLVEGNPRIGPCLGNVGKLIGIGLNYSDHAAETGLAIPHEPIIFMKATSAICGSYDNVEIPSYAKKTDWEVELAFAIGMRAKNIDPEKALDYVAGYFIVNDISERSWQIEREGQWTKGKSHDTFAPLGPWFVSADEVCDPGNLTMTLDVNGVRRQDGSSRTVIFSISELVVYLSKFMTLNPGDVVTTGTPPGVGLGMKPPVYLNPGDVMRLEIEGLGYQEQTVVQADD